ncbi:hypothetical protein BIW11_05029 [Tropilaelaps mercedesae]|uniref:Uncharacterized protein n=1 Tax=Tropilaelaps mercedesae TaxID=418985 RepID=A0A1V9WY93_9ACAR|nr:hypothetical protein BIW11_05029 [Tropilaelaps mercedesae]
MSLANGLPSRLRRAGASRRGEQLRCKQIQQDVVLLLKINSRRGSPPHSFPPATP